MDPVLKEKLCLRRLDKVYCRLAPSTVDGVGIFAIRDIPKGTNPFKGSYMCTDAILCDPEKIGPDSIKKMLHNRYPRSKDPLSNEVASHAKGAATKNKQIVPMYPNQLSWIDFLNYSKNPNIELLESGEWVTTRDILTGEEVLEDPSKLFKDDGTYKTINVSPNQYLNLKH